MIPLLCFDQSCILVWMPSLKFKSWTDSCVCGPKRTSQLVQCSQTYFCKAICGEAHLFSSTLLQEIFFNAFGHRSNLFQTPNILNKFNRDFIYLESYLKLLNHLDDLESPKAEPSFRLSFQEFAVIFLSTFSFLTSKIFGA